ncbi:MAG: TonB family protein [Proteobacteria bacterium]|nr:TonB family protein [Pseudomonadota bacterium]
MRETIRYSSSALIAVVMVLTTFLAMTWLIASPKYNKSMDFDPIEFTKVADMEKTQPDKPEPPKTLPKQQKVEQPPALPKIDITSQVDPDTDAEIPTGIALPKFADFSKFSKPIMSPNGNPTEANQDLIVLLPVMPQYPIKQLNNKVEGWVKVEFVVNELGNTTQIKVIDANPKRVFNQATIRAIRKSKFKPLRIDGKAVSQTAVQVIEFKLGKEE